MCYTSGVYDGVTGLYYLNARYYNTESAEFITRDSYQGRIQEPQTLNRYVYCLNNTIIRIDPSGHDSYVFSNIAYEFRKKVKRPVIASDGTVVYYGAELPVVSRVDKYWRTWRNRAKSKRKKNAGWIMYDNLSIMSYSGLKSMTIMDVCKWNGDYLK